MEYCTVLYLIIGIIVELRDGHLEHDAAVRFVCFFEEFDFQSID